MPPLNMIEAVGLTKAYGETQALAGVSFDVPAGTNVEGRAPLHVRHLRAPS